MLRGVMSARRDRPGDASWKSSLQTRLKLTLSVNAHTQRNFRDLQAIRLVPESPLTFISEKVQPLNLTTARQGVSFVEYD